MGLKVLNLFESSFFLYVFMHSIKYHVIFLLLRATTLALQIIFSSSLYIDSRESIPVRASLVHTHFIAHYRFPLQCHAPHHTAAATVASTLFSLLFPLSRFIFCLPLITHKTTFKGMLFIPQAGFHKRRCCDAHFFCRSPLEERCPRGLDVG